MTQLLTAVEETVREAQGEANVEDILGSLHDKSLSDQTIREALLELMESGVLVLDWRGKVRLRTQGKG